MRGKIVLSGKDIGYLLLLAGMLLLIGRACVFVLSLYHPPPPPPPQPSFTSVSVENEIAYFQGGDGIYALRVSDGKQVWHVKKNLFGQIVVDNGVVYAAELNTLYALHASDGKQLWQSAIIEYAYAQPPQVINGLVYVYNGETLYVLHAANGSLAWKTDIQSPASFQVVNGVFYYSETSGLNSQQVDILYALRASDGHQIWSFTTPPPVCVLLGFTIVSDVFYTNTTCQDHSGRIYAFQASNGRQIWNTALEGDISVADGNVYVYPSLAVNTSDNLTYALNASDGQKRWQFAGDQSQEAYAPKILAPGNGKVYEILENRIYALRASDGQTLWSIVGGYNDKTREAESFYSLTFSEVDNNIFYYRSTFSKPVTGTPFTRLHALDATTGKQLWLFQQSVAQSRWDKVSIDTKSIFITASDTQSLTKIYVLQTDTGKQAGSVQLKVRAKDILITDNYIFIDLVVGDTTFSYYLFATQPTKDGGKQLWSFMA
ncbi:MAG TPA: PQQ-binding-like beta-propeller repeat protein [Ktedonobacteraceae bacterium]|nr:PQQ-binding-like beta-propeller repeat protein [Ktedonobacteraceae bacterium]